MRYLKSKLQKEMRKYYEDKFGVRMYSQVYAEIYGTPMYLSEVEVRYLEVKCHDCDNFEEFCKNHVIYNGPSKRGGEPMVWRRSGKFMTHFKPGFYDTTVNLAFEIF